MRLKITSVDMDGYNGREYHPTKPDKGLVVRAVHMETWYCDPDGIGDNTSLDAEIPAVNRGDGRATEHVLSRVHKADQLQFVFRCITEDGRILDLMDHEVEIITGGKDWLR